MGAIETVLAALNEAGVRYLIVGGVAVVLHGYLRTTADLDLVVELTPPNALAAVRALERLGYRPRAPVPAEQFADQGTRESWVRDKGLTVFSMWSDRLPGLEVDLFVTEPFDFGPAHARAVRVDLDRISTMVVALDDLIALKRASGRPLDLEDVAALQALSNEDDV